MDPLDGGLSVEAREAFDRYVESLEAGSAIDFEDWCRGRPAALEVELRVLWLQWLAARGSSARSEPAAPSPGPGRPSSGIPLRDVDLGFASAILARLGAHGETWRRYRHEGEIAHGGQGAVLRVWDEDLNRSLAMKVLHDKGRCDSAAPTVDPRSLGRFLEEALVTGQLDHPGIVPVHELGLDSNGRVYFTMKLVKGRTLREVFELCERGEEGWTRTRALTVLLKVCEATAYAHAKGVIHRDLKPSNVMVGRFGEVFVMDWGLARVLGQHDLKDIRIRPPPGTAEPRSDGHAAGSFDSPLITMDGDVVGTPSYMSPEQALGRLDEVGPQSDVYSTGAMLYHLLSGHAPYVERGTRRSNHAIWYKVQKGPPTPLHQCAPGTPAELVAICEKAMARDWRARYGDTSELAEDLSAFIDHRVVHAYRTGAVAELGKWIVRNRSLAGALAAVVILLVGGLATSLVLKQLAEHRLDKLVQLSQLQDHEDLLAQVDGLWPARPARLPEYEAWIAAAQALVDDLSQHRARREELRRNALPLSPDERKAQREAHPENARLARL